MFYTWPDDHLLRWHQKGVDICNLATADDQNSNSDKIGEEVRYTKTGFYTIENSESECKAMSSIKWVFSELPSSTRCRSQRDRMMWIVGDTSPAGQGSSPPTQTPIGSQCWHIPHPPLPPLFPHMSVSNVFCRVVRGEEKRWCLKVIRALWHS